MFGLHILEDRSVFFLFSEEMTLQLISNAMKMEHISLFPFQVNDRTITVRSEQETGPSDSTGRQTVPASQNITKQTSSLQRNRWCLRLVTNLVECSDKTILPHSISSDLSLTNDPHSSITRAVIETPTKQSWRKKTVCQVCVSSQGIVWPDKNGIQGQKRNKQNE